MTFFKENEKLLKHRQTVLIFLDKQIKNTVQIVY